MSSGDIRNPRLMLAFVLVLILFAGAAIIFARVQNVWIDESTQLSGMTLPLDSLLAWLTRAADQPFGVPPDRMPPLSYIIDHVGWLIWGSNPFAFRMLHALIAGSGLLVLMVALARRFSLRAALVTGLLLALSPKFIDVAVEVRAYPLLVAVSCAQIALLLGGNVAGRPKRLALFVLLGLLSAYSHYFGVVATSAYFCAVMLDARNMREALRVIAAYAVMLLLGSGLIPFVASATEASQSPISHAPGLVELVAYLTQLLGSAPMMVNPWSAALYFGGAGLLLLSGGVGLLALIGERKLEVRHHPAFSLAIALAAGVTATVLASVVVRGFEALAPRYNLWMLPLVAALIGIAADGAISLPGKIARWLRYAALGLLAIGAIWTQAGFLSRAQWYVHGPSVALEELISKTGKPTAIVYLADPQVATWSWGFFPLYWHHRDTLPQWLLTPDGTQAIRIGMGGDPNGAPQPLSALAKHSQIIVARIQMKSYTDLRALAAAGGTPAPVEDLAPALSFAGWKAQPSIGKPGFFWLTAQIYTNSKRP